MPKVKQSHLVVNGEADFLFPCSLLPLGFQGRPGWNHVYNDNDDFQEDGDIQGNANFQASPIMWIRIILAVVIVPAKEIGVSLELASKEEPSLQRCVVHPHLNIVVKSQFFFLKFKLSTTSWCQCG